MRERRRHPRYPAVFPIAIDAAEKAGRIGVVRNLSADGLLLATQSHFRLGQMLDLHFRERMDGPLHHLRGKITRVARSTEMTFPQIIAVTFEKALERLDSVLDARIGEASDG